MPTTLLEPRIHGRWFPRLTTTVAWTRDPITLLKKVARESGDVVRIDSLGYTSYLISDPALVEQVLVRDHRNYQKDLFTRDLSRVIGNGLLTSEGEFWRRQRRLANPAFHKDRVRGYGDDMVRITTRMLNTFVDGSKRDVHNDMMGLTLEIIAATMFSADIANDAKDVGTVVELVMEHFADPFVSIFPILARIPTRRNRQLKLGLQRLDEILFKVIANARKSKADNGDLLSMLLSVKDEDGSGMSDSQLRDELMTIFLAGHETTALTLCWTFMLLSQYPAVRARLESELAQVLGGRSPKTEDLPALPYTDAVIRESMRLYPPVWAMGREALVDVELGGYKMPKGAQLIMCEAVIQRDRRWFDEPDRFLPERWLDGLDKRLPRYAYFPFGGGPRLCIGNGFAMMEANLCLATIAQQFRLNVPRNYQPTLMPSITLRPKGGMPVTIEARKR